MTKIQGLILALVSVGTFTGAYFFYRPAPPKPEVYAPAAKQSDGSIILERKPDPKLRAKLQLPKGGKLEREMSVTVKPKQPVLTNSTAMIRAADCPPCPPVTVDLDLVKMPDDSRRVIAKSPDGEIINAVDIPVEPAKPPAPELKWAAGPAWNPVSRKFGAWADRDLGPFRVGVQVNQGEVKGFDYWVKAGVRF